MSQVFISHSSKDKEIAERVVKGLTENGIKSWISHLEIPAGAPDWAAAITRAIANSAVLVVLLSESSSQSPEVATEVNMARERRIPYIPVVLRSPIELGEGLSYPLQGVQRLDWNLCSGSIPQRHIQALVNSLKPHLPLLDKIEEPTSASDRSRDSNLLLRRTLKAVERARLTGASPRVIAELIFSRLFGRYDWKSLPDILAKECGWRSVAYAKQRLESLKSNSSAIGPVKQRGKTKTLRKPSTLAKTSKPAARDYSKYEFNGTAFPKNRLVLAVVTEHTKQKPAITLEELQKDFPDELQGWAGVVRRRSDIRDERSRYYFLEDADLLRLGSEVLAVCNQWGLPNFKKFNSKAKRLNYTIKKVAPKKAARQKARKPSV